MISTTKSASSASASAFPEDERKSLNAELWHACAGPLASLPAVGNHVVYFPQGHSEQLASSTNKKVDWQIPNYPNLPAQFICQLDSVILHADNETDEVCAQMTLQPLSAQEREQLVPDQEIPSRQPSNLFCKALTASDTSTHGGFSIPRRAAEKVFPLLDFTQQLPAQQLIARDLHGVEWKFRHIYRGQPKRHLLTTGWSVFVSAKRLTAGDSVIFIRGESEQLLLGIRRANRLQTIMPSVLSSDSMHIGVLATAAHAVATHSKFTVFYNPRTSPSEFMVPFSKFAKAMYHTCVSVGMRFRMLFETEESSVRRYTGTITGIGELDAVCWPNSHWRTVKVGWDESTPGERHKRVSLWEIEPLTAFLVYPPFSSWKSKRPWSEKLCSTSNHGDADMENVKSSFMLMKDDKDCQGLVNPATGANAWEPSHQKHETGVFPIQSNAMTAAALQEICGTPKQLLAFQQEPIEPQQLDIQGIPSKQFLGVQQQPFQSQSDCGSHVQQKKELSFLQQQLPKSFWHQAPQLSQKGKHNFEQQSQHSPFHPQLACNVTEEKLQRLLDSEVQRQQALQLPSIINSINQFTSLQPHVSTVPFQLQPPVSTLPVEMQPHVFTTSSLLTRVSSTPVETSSSSTNEHNPFLNSAAFHKPLALQAIINNLRSDDNLLESNFLPSAVNTLQQHAGIITRPEFHQDSISASLFSSVHSSDDSNSSVESVDGPPPTGGKYNLSTEDISMTSSLPSLLQNSFGEPLESMGVINSFFIPDSSFGGSIPTPSLPLISLRDNCQEHDLVHSDSQSRLLSGVNIDASLLVSPNCISNLSSRTCPATETQCHPVCNLLQGQTAVGMETHYLGSVFDEHMDNDVSLQQFQSVGHVRPPTRTYTKVYKRGSVGRSIDLARFNSYTELRYELARMFNLEGQIDDPERSAWQLAFIDEENDLLLLGDEPWELFVNIVRCIKILPRLEVIQMEEHTDLLSSITTECSNPGSAITSAYSLDY